MSRRASVRPSAPGASLCPAYDISNAFRGMSDGGPGSAWLADVYLLNKLKDKFVKRNERVLRGFAPDAVAGGHFPLRVPSARPRF